MFLVDDDTAEAPGTRARSARSGGRRVGELDEVKAGRLRALITESLWMRGDDVTLLAKRDVRIDGDRINLG